MRDPLELFWRDRICRFCMIPAFRRWTFGVTVTSTDEQRRAWLDEVRMPAREVFLPDSA